MPKSVSRDSTDLLLLILGIVAVLGALAAAAAMRPRAPLLAGYCGAVLVSVLLYAAPRGDMGRAGFHHRIVVVLVVELALAAVLAWPRRPTTSRSASS